jgi:hypothetical protein
MGTDARSVSEIAAAPKSLRTGCSEPGCGVPPSIAVYKHANGGPACISHAADQGPKQHATRNGAERTRRRRVRYMPDGTPDPDWSSPKALRAWLEDRGGRVERGELDLPAVPTKLAEIARGTYTDEALEKLDGLEALIKGRLLGGGI